MKRPLKTKLPRQQLAVIGATAGLCFLAAALVAFGLLYAGRLVLMTGLIAAIPALAQLILLLPRMQEPEHPTEDPELSARKAALLLRKYRCKRRYHKLRNPLAALLIGAAALGMHLVFWRYTVGVTGQMSYLVPVVLAVVFVVAIALEKWCAHAADENDTYHTALLKSLISALLILRVAVLLCAVAATIKLLGLFDADAIARVLLSILAVYETAVLAFCVGIRLIRKDMDTKPELLSNLIGMGADMNILTYLEENTGITMRSLWSLRLIKQLLPGAVLGVALLVWLSTCFVQIEAHQEGALFRMGRLTDKALQPGFHVTLPWPLDKVDVYDTRSLGRLTIGYIPQGDQDNTWTGEHGSEEYLLLLGDGNEMVSINLQIEYRIDDLLAYIRSSATPESMLQAQAYEIITARTIATDLDSLLAADREVFSETFRQELTQRIAPYNTGLSVVSVVLESIHPPVDIAEVYQDIISAGIDAEYIRLNAQAAANTQIMDAKKQQTQTVGVAISEKYERVAEAQAAVTEFMAAAAADGNYRDEYRFYKYLDAITKTYENATMILAGEGIDTSKIVISGFKEEPEPEQTAPTYPDEEYEEEYFEYEGETAPPTDEEV